MLRKISVYAECIAGDVLSFVLADKTTLDEAHFILSDIRCIL